MVSLDFIQSSQKEFFLGGQTLPVAFRIQQIRKLRQGLIKHQDALLQALQRDLGKPHHDSVLYEFSPLIMECDNFMKHLKNWLTKSYLDFTLFSFPSRQYSSFHPYGSALILSPWNYPLYLSIMPLIGSIAAGNCTIIKPSEMSPHCSQVIKTILEDIFDQHYIFVALGDKHIAKHLTQLPFDKIFFTGSTAVAKNIVSQSLSHLPSLTLELGGQCVAMIDRATLSTREIKIALKRVLWAKFLNSGQTCVAPNELVVMNFTQDQLAPIIDEVLNEVLCDGYQSRLAIVNKEHIKRLSTIISKLGGHFHSQEKWCHPVIIHQSTLENCQEVGEIFGPVLPIIYENDWAMIQAHLLKRSSPLAYYYFGWNKDHLSFFKTKVKSGSFCHNDCIMQLAHPQLPFGGVGESGQGRYHGKSSLHAFSYQRSHMKRYYWPEVSFRFRPILFAKLLKRFLR